MRSRDRENEIYMKLFWGGKLLRRPPWPWWKKSRATTAVTIVVVVFFCFVATLSSFAGWFDHGSIFTTGSSSDGVSLQELGVIRCGKANETETSCSKYEYPRANAKAKAKARRAWKKTCPDYFRWIHQDLRPWKESGITREMVENGRKTAHFRLVIVEGRVYVEKYRDSIQTRAMFSLWGILQLMRWYPGRLPDLELMFDCDDRPVVPSKTSGAHPPPLFRYCSDHSSLDIVFPDWSFWGWAEINIKPWKDVLKDIKQGNTRMKWKDREAYAYWKGNPHVAPTRADLLKCNVSTEHDWNARLYIQDWEQESKLGYNQSNLEDQCTHRYKIYIEGWAWSVSEKYILACDAMTLYVEPKFYDFFIRGMMPLHHYWPIRDNTKCTSLKFAVDWGNNHTHKAQAIGEAASKFIQEDLKMEYVYDYMFHVLNEYAKLLKFKPTIPETAVELCPETMACATNGAHRRFMEDSFVKFPSDSVPCSIPPDDTAILQQFQHTKANAIRQAQIWEDEYSETKNKGQYNNILLTT